MNDVTADVPTSFEPRFHSPEQVGDLARAYLNRGSWGVGVDLATAVLEHEAWCKAAAEDVLVERPDPDDPRPAVMFRSPGFALDD